MHAPLRLDEFAPPEADPAPADRRSHARLPPSEFAWIRDVRLKYGPRVEVLDLSPGGALLQTDVPLRPGTNLALEIVGRGVETVPLRVLRCQLAAISEQGAVYRGACEFKRPLDLAASRGAGLLRADLAFKHLVERRRAALGRAASADARERLDRELPGLLRAFQATLRMSDPLDRAVCDILIELVSAMARGEPAAVLRVRLETQLRRVMPDLRLAITPRCAMQGDEGGRESLCFPSEAQPGAAGVVSVTLSTTSPMPDWQFQLLDAGGSLLELLPALALPGGSAAAATAAVAAGREAREYLVPELPPGPAAEANVGWQKIVVRYREGRLLKGFTHDFHPSRNQFSLWPSINAAPSEGVHIPTSQLKAVFFVRDFMGNPDRIDEPAFDGASAGRRLEITFADDEVLVGSTLSYRPDGIGFFVSPADRGGNNLRVFVVSSAIRHVRFP